MDFLLFLIRWTFRLTSLTLILFGIGFVLFANEIDRTPAPVGEPADGIVALTGGTARIGAAVQLLADSKAKRLLITGVNPATRRGELSELVPDSDHLFACCIDLGRAAQNTAGNAAETRNWVRKRGFSSLIVVTSSYHMPRTLAELQRTMPEVRLIPYSVIPPDFHADNWWSYPGTLRLLFSEYVKFLPSLARLAATGIKRFVLSGGVRPASA